MTLTSQQPAGVISSVTPFYDDWGSPKAPSTATDDAETLRQADDTGWPRRYPENMTVEGSSFENPTSGEHITLLNTAGTGDPLLIWELCLAAGGRVPSRHAHPEQEETFRVVEGCLRMRVGGRRRSVGPGQCVRVPRGVVHHFANAGRQPARVVVETRPALEMAAMLHTAAAMAQQQQAAKRRWPHPLDLALFMDEFRREVRAPYLPRSAVQIVNATLARLARRFGLDVRYQQARRGVFFRYPQPEAHARH